MRPHCPFFSKKHPHFSTFLQPPIFHFLQKHPHFISCLRACATCRLTQKPGSAPEPYARYGRPYLISSHVRRVYKFSDVECDIECVRNCACNVSVLILRYGWLEGKGSPYSITERTVPELIPVRSSQPAGDVSHKPGGRVPLLSARPAVTSLRGLLKILLLDEQRHDGCEQFA